MANSNSNRTLVPEAKDSLEKFKYEVASDMCVKNIFTLISSSYFIFFFADEQCSPLHFYAGCFNLLFIFFISFNSLNLK